jgi:hypothetical protein
MLEELIDLSAGLGVVLLPVLLLSIPGIILFVVLPAILLLALAAPVALVGALIAAPILLARRLRRPRRTVDRRVIRPSAVKMPPNSGVA